MKLRDEDLGALLRRFLGAEGTLFLAFHQGELSANAVRNNANMPQVETDCPVLMLLALLGEMPSQSCLRCRGKKTLLAFARGDGGPYGRSSTCSSCERERSKKKRRGGTRK